MNKLNMLISVILGSFIGALLGVLFAPDRGDKTRKQISKKSDEYAELLKSEVDDFAKNLRKKYESALSDTEELINKGKSRAVDLKEDVKKKL